MSLASLAKAKPDEVTLPLPQGYTREHDVYQGHEHRNHRWAMAVDLDRCYGCNACVVACYAENNIPVVGKKEIRRAHELTWMRIDRYDEGEGAQTRSLFQPMMCQQCDSAPCETVCPVYAVHGEEGLNEQVYNRCVGTRYCSTTAPTSLAASTGSTPSGRALHYQLNPDVRALARGDEAQLLRAAEEVTLRAKAEGRRCRTGRSSACADVPFSGVHLWRPDGSERAPLRWWPGSASLPGAARARLPAVFYLKRIVAEGRTAPGRRAAAGQPRTDTHHSRS